MILCRVWAWIRRLFSRAKPSRPTLRPLASSVTHFYRYSSTQHLDWLRPVILNHEIYIPTAKQLNDPAEAKPVLASISADRIAEFLKRMFEKNNPGLPPDRYRQASLEIDMLCSHKTSDELLRHMANYFYSLVENTRIYSLSKRWDNMALWANYADNHHGYCLEFARQGLFNAAREAIYDDTFRFDVSDPAHVAFEWYFCKTPEWSNEEEIRIVLPQMMGGPVFTIGPACLTRVILGKDISPIDRKQICEWAASRSPPLAVVQVEFDAYQRRLIVKSASPC